MREEVVRKYGSSQYTLPSCLEPPCDLQHKEKTLEELYSSKLPISMDHIRKVTHTKVLKNTLSKICVILNPI